MRVISSTLGALTLAVLTAGCGGSSSSTAPTPTPTPTPTPPAAGTVNILGERGNQSFNPNPSPLPATHMITWTNTDSITHHVVADDGSFDTGNLAGGQSSAAITVPAAGKTYHCSIHPSMVGTISAGN
jgi:plastocyanin